MDDFFNPLIALVRNDLIGKSDHDSFAIILMRANQYFFKQDKLFDYNQNINMQTIDNKFLGRSNVIVQLDALINDDTSAYNNIQYAGDTVIKTFLEQLNLTLYYNDLGSGKDEDMGDCFFLTISKLLYGTTNHYYTVRQFF